MTYVDKLSKQAARARARSARAAAVVEAAAAKRDTIRSRIPPGQPVLLGHHSQARHERDLARIDTARRTVYEQSIEAEHQAQVARKHERHAARIASAVRAGSDIEDYSAGDVVRAAYTSGGANLSFIGVVAGRTLNTWHLRCLTSPFPGPENEAYFIGRVLTNIPAAGRPRFSANNRIIGRAEAPHEEEERQS